jgi:hypothetical protein
LEVEMKYLMRSVVAALFQKREPTAFQRCLAVHMHFASPHRALS